MPATNQSRVLGVSPGTARRWVHAPFWAAIVLALTAIGGCTSAPSGGLAGPRSGDDPSDAALHGMDAAVAYRAFAPSRVRIHPLTHVDASGSRGMLVLHYELRDRFGDSV